MLIKHYCVNKPVAWMYIVINIWKLLRYLFVHAAFSINLRIFTNTPIFNLIPSEYEANSNDSHRTSLTCALILAGNFVCSTKLLASLWKLIRNRSDLHFMLQHGGLLNIIKVFYTTFIFSFFCISQKLINQTIQQGW